MDLHKDPHPRDISPEQLNKQMTQEAPLTLLDVRNRDDYERWKIEAGANTHILNVPALEMKATSGQDELGAAAVAYVSTRMSDIIAKDKPLVIVCAKGKNAAVISDALNKAGYHTFSLCHGMQGWGNTYNYRTLLETANLSITQVSRVARGCLSYIISSGADTLIVDPGRQIAAYTAWCQQHGLNVRYVVDTHCHADHLSGGVALASVHKTHYHLHPNDSIHAVDQLPARFSYTPLWDEQILPLGRTQIRVLHIPGHTLGNVALLVGDQYLLTGDSVFLTSIARPDLGGHAETWTKLHYTSLRRLLELPDSLIVLPGHFSHSAEANSKGQFISELGQLKKSNAGLLQARESEESFLSYILSSLPRFPPEYVDIKRANLGLIDVTDEQASEWELGRNVCALNH